MEAKDTVIKRDEVSGYTFGDKVWDMLEELLLFQAEISFKAGYLQGHSKGWNDGVKVGIKKVVEWIRNGIVMRVPRGTRVYRADKEKVLVQFDYTEWQAKLKEWGLETS